MFFEHSDELEAAEPAEGGLEGAADLGMRADREAPTCDTEPPAPGAEGQALRRGGWPVSRMGTPVSKDCRNQLIFPKNEVIFSKDDLISRENDLIPRAHLSHFPGGMTSYRGHSDLIFRRDEIMLKVR